MHVRTIHFICVYQIEDNKISNCEMCSFIPSHPPPKIKITWKRKGNIGCALVYIRSLEMDVILSPNANFPGNIPEYWTDMNQQTTCMIQLQPGQSEYNSVKDKFLQTGFFYKIEKVMLHLKITSFKYWGTNIKANFLYNTHSFFIPYYIDFN